MARPRGVVLDDSHRQRIADGTATLAEVAAELGIERQTAWSTFRRRGWSTTAAQAEPAEPSADNPISPAAAPGKPAGQRQQSAPTNKAATSAQARSARSSEAPRAIPGNPGIQEQAWRPACAARSVVRAGEELTEAARQELANIALLGLGHARSLLARDVVGANALKSTSNSASLAVDSSRQAGFSIGANEVGAVPEMRISSYSCEEEAEIQRQAEAEYHELQPQLDPDDDEVAPTTPRAFQPGR